jgi:acyl-CoA thioester hydrolase
LNPPRQPARRSGRAKKTVPSAPPVAAEAPAATPATVAPPAWAPMASVPLSVRWGDLDAFNHVNNAAFLVYVQEARLAWLAAIDGTWFDETMMPVVAAATMNYRRQLTWPAEIVVELAATRVGNSSLTIAHRVVAAGDRECVYADGDVVMVWIDPSSGRSVPLPAAIRSACRQSDAAATPATAQ